MAPYLVHNKGSPKKEEIKEHPSRISLSLSLISCLSSNFYWLSEGGVFLPDLPFVRYFYV